MAAITGATMAALFLERRGYEVLATSWTCEAGTVDVVARAPEGEIVFAEAALSEDRAAGFPEERLDDAARARMEALSAAWLAGHDCGDRRVRFDVVSALVLDARAGRAYVRHHIDALGGSWR